MAGTPFTKGKKSEGPKGGTGKFTKGTGGHTSAGHVSPPGSSMPSTSAALTHIGNLKKRQTGAPATRGMPK